MPKHIYYSIFTFLILLSFSCNNIEVKNEKKLNVSEKNQNEVKYYGKDFFRIEGTIFFPLEAILEVITANCKGVAKT